MSKFEDMVFDVECRPELQKAILNRLTELGYESVDFEPDSHAITTRVDGDVDSYWPERLMRHIDPEKTRQLKTISDLYDIEPKHTITFDDDEPIEISKESYDALRESLK